MSPKLGQLGLRARSLSHLRALAPLNPDEQRELATRIAPLTVVEARRTSESGERINDSFSSSDQHHRRCRTEPSAPSSPTRPGGSSTTGATDSPATSTQP